MKKLKTLIFFLMLFVAIGFAAVSTSLSINGETSIANNPNDFFVYYSDIYSNSKNETLEINTSSETSFSFGATLSKIGESIKINFNVVNSSKNYDAEVSISCSEGDEHVKITSSISDNIIPAREATTGYVEATVQRSYVGDTGVEQNISCTLNANAIERDSISDSPIIELQPINTEFPIGKEITIGTETFNVIEETKDYVSLLSQYSLNENYKQSEEYTRVRFSENNGWEYKYWPSDIDIKEWSTFPHEYIENYISYLKTELGNIDITGDLISLRQLESLGCTPIDEYLIEYEGTCENSPYGDWLVNNQGWWTKTALFDESNSIWSFTDKGYIIGDMGYDNEEGIRPVITLQKSALNKRIIEFSIEGVTYQAEEGMYWSEWVTSKYNTGGFQLYQDELNFRVHLDGSHYFYNDDAIYDSIIIEEKNYTKTYSELL